MITSPGYHKSTGRNGTYTSTTMAIALPIKCGLPRMCTNTGMGRAAWCRREFLAGRLSLLPPNFGRVLTSVVRFQG